MNEEGLFIIIIVLSVAGFGLSLVLFLTVYECSVLKKKHKQMKRKYNDLCDYLEEIGGNRERNMVMVDTSEMKRNLKMCYHLC